jgi:integrase/recombinase XerD
MTALRSIKLLCEQLGFAPPGRTLHAFRRTFAVNYLRRGGSVFHLQKVLGHSVCYLYLSYGHVARWSVAPLMVTGI